jgi:hypothetical protein
MDKQAMLIISFFSFQKKKGVDAVSPFQSSEFF